MTLDEYLNEYLAVVKARRTHEREKKVENNQWYAKGIALGFGRKFVDEDLMTDAKLRVAASEFVRDYEGDFAYMVELKAKRSLSIGQLRGALNVMRAQVLREQEATATPVTVGDASAFAKISELFATASASGLKWPKIRLMTNRSNTVVLSVAGAKAKAPGAINVTNGGSWDDRVYYGRLMSSGSLDRPTRFPADVIDLLTRFAADPAKVAAEYGKLTGYCCFCQSELTDDRSTEVGYGPICAKRYGLAWGKKVAA